MKPIIRLSIPVTPEVKRALKAEAQARGISMSDLVRERIRAGNRKQRRTA